MLRTGFASRRPARSRSSLLGKLAIGLGFLIAFPSAVAYQDMMSLVTGAEAQKTRWGAYLERSAAGSVHQAEMPFIDAVATGSISGAGMKAANLGMVAFRGSDAAEETSDEERVNRGDKQGRLAQVAPMAPPRMFNAGSIFERSSSLMGIEAEPDLRMAFVVPPILGQEIEIAGTFHVREDRQTPGVPAMLASLVNNHTPDILATAYAPPEPDYASTSPFASLLRDEAEDENAGRFIPPIGPRDHAWMGTPLPPRVFGAAEQKCLAEGIYFEARSESLKGQAAVAQVILNRVRNPAYPSTICGVVYQNRHMRNSCQFSFACEGRALRIASPRHYEIAEEVAMAVTAGKIFIPEIGSSTHYHATYVNPRWARSMHRLERIGLHIFYRTRNGGWS